MLNVFIQLVCEGIGMPFLPANLAAGAAEPARCVGRSCSFLVFQGPDWKPTGRPAGQQSLRRMLSLHRSKLFKLSTQNAGPQQQVYSVVLCKVLRTGQRPWFRPQLRSLTRVPSVPRFRHEPTKVLQRGCVNFGGVRSTLKTCN